MDENLQPLAVLDFGFLTTAGDPRLDAAIAAAVADMYGPHAPQITRAMTATAAMPMVNYRRRTTRLEYRPSRQPPLDGLGRPAHAY